jgi:hypothetical protein
MVRAQLMRKDVQILSKVEQISACSTKLIFRVCAVFNRSLLNESTAHFQFPDLRSSRDIVGTFLILPSFAVDMARTVFHWDSFMKAKFTRED